MNSSEISPEQRSKIASTSLEYLDKALHDIKGKIEHERQTSDTPDWVGRFKNCITPVMGFLDLAAMRHEITPEVHAVAKARLDALLQDVEAWHTDFSYAGADIPEATKEDFIQRLDIRSLLPH